MPSERLYRDSVLFKGVYDRALPILMSKKIHVEINQRSMRLIEQSSPILLLLVSASLRSSSMTMAEYASSESVSRVVRLC